MRYLALCWIMFIHIVPGLAQTNRDGDSFELILIGDGGGINGLKARELVSKYIPHTGTPSALIFLGGNIYPRGLADTGDKDRKAGEQILLNQVDMSSDFDNVFFIPGNHDWKNGHHDGLRYLLNQQAFLDSLRNPKVQMLPRDGCPGPEEIHLSNDLMLVFIDTQWFLHPWTKPEGESSPCETKSSVDVTIQLDDILNRNQGKRVLVVGHHPVFTYGRHGGVFTFKDHLFPFTEANENLYIPLPIVGSLFPLYRKIFGNVQDIAHPLNKALRRGLQDIMRQYPGTIYVSAHENNQQYIESDSVHYIVSGAGSATTPVKQKGFSKFGSSEIGFVRLRFKTDGRAEADYFGENGILYSAAIPKQKVPEVQRFTEIKTDTLWVAARASYQYEAGRFRKMLLGDNYRAEWAQKISLQAFDLGREKGGLKILSKGGGMETMALRLNDVQGREYTLRTVEKYPTRALPSNFRKTFLQTVKQDQVSADHPYAATVIPRLAQSAGIYHANPKIVFAPNDPRWGIYRKDFAGQIMTFEERPDGSGLGMSFFGSPEKMISTHKLLEHMAKDHDVQVDQHWVLRSRLFDMWIGDWDRHDDQWRWGEYTRKKEKIYRPIPRDRDQAFFVNEGFVPHQWRARYKSPYLEGFDHHILWAPGLMQVGRWFDRSFLNALPEDDFVHAATDLANRMTDQAIDSAAQAWPSEIYALHGNEIVSKLKSRRSVLVKNVRTYYQFLAKQVDVMGSDKREWFESKWLPGGNLNVQVYKLNKEGQKGKLLFNREFRYNETKEVRLYGMAGEDVFHFSGVSLGGETVRVIGGDGRDQVWNDSGGDQKIFVYDHPAGVNIEGASIHNRTSTDPLVNEYDRKDYQYDKFEPKHTLTYNVDDGVFIGTGFSTVTHGFRKKPYLSHHLLQGSYAIKTHSFTVRYEGRFPQYVGKWDLELDADVRSPNYVNNFFGWGNESVFDQSINQQPGINVANSIDYYRLRFRDIRGEVKLRRKIGQWGYFKVGPVFQRGEIVNPTEDRYIKEYNATLPESVLGQAQNFAGLVTSFGVDKRDNHNYTTRGVVFKHTSRAMDGFDAPSFTSHNTSFTLYQSFRLPARVTYVFNAGGGLNTGVYQLYQAQALDGKSEIRGYHKTRFYGDSKVYFNNEVRIKLGSLRTYLFPASVGMHFFYDVGRVWYKDATGIDPSSPTGKSDDWHRGYGGGLWFVPYDLTTVVTEVGHSKEGTLFYLRLGFLF